jgi:hypothetical protein
MSHWYSEVWIRIWDILVVLLLSLFRLNSNLGHFGSFAFISVSFGDLRLLVSWWAGGRCGMACSDEDHDSSRRPGAEDQEWSHISGTRWPSDWEVGWRCVRSAPCTWRWEAWISWLNLKIKIDGLLVVWAQNHCDGLSLVWPQNHWYDFLRFYLKTGGDDFSWFALKTSGFEFFGLGLKTDGYGLLICVVKLPRQFFDLDLKIKQTSVYRLRHKTNGGRTARDIHRDMPESKLR